jgi:hypothetical protein
LQLNGVCAFRVLLLCGVRKGEERTALNEFNCNERLADSGATEGWVRPYRISERPLCVAIWMIDKNDSKSVSTITIGVQALCAAYFRGKWAA